MAANVTAVVNWTSEPDNVTELNGTLSPGSSDGDLRWQFWEYRLSLQLQAYVGLLIVLTGLIGNSLCIATLTFAKVTSTAIYLINLAWADLTVTIVGQLCRVFPRAMFGFDTAWYHPWICKTWFFVNHSAATISGWTLVAVTIERVMVVFLPLRVRSFCTKKKAVTATVVINILCTACYLHYFWTYGSVYDDQGNLQAGCTILLHNPALVPYILYVRPWQDFIIRSAGPFILLFICNCLIIGKLIYEGVHRKALSASKGGDEQKIRSMTAMLLSVSITYLICISPLQIMYLIDKSDPFGWKILHRWQAMVALRWAFAIDVYYINHAINFILYCISGREFRRSLLLMLAGTPCLGRPCRRYVQRYSGGSSVSQGSSTAQKYTTEESVHI